jgi:hypothetical protein
MALKLAFLAAAAALSATAAHAASVEIKDAVVRVTVIPEQRSDVKVEVIRSNPRLPLEIRTLGDRTVVDGGLWHAIRDCHGLGGKARVGVRHVGGVDYDDMPQLVIRTPRNVELSANGAVVGVIGRSGGVSLKNSGCSNWTIADVAGQATIQESGAGSIRMGASDRLAIKLSGAASIHATQVRQFLDVGLSGAGGVRVDRLTGDMDARVSGVGQVKVADGRANVRASVSGMGGVEFLGSADNLDASISGLGGIRVREVTGQLHKSVSGAGHVKIG